MKNGTEALNHHVLKTWDIYFDEIAAGRKTFEVRKNDRDFRAGDTVELVRVVPPFNTSTRNGAIPQMIEADRPPLILRIGTVLYPDQDGAKFGLQEGFVAFSLLPLSTDRPAVWPRIASWAAVAIIAGVFLGLAWGRAQEANRADLCQRYGEYCSSSTTIAIPEYDPTKIPRIDVDHGPVEGSFRVSVGQRARTAEEKGSKR